MRTFLYLYRNPLNRHGWCRYGTKNRISSKTRSEVVFFSKFLGFGLKFNFQDFQKKNSCSLHSELRLFNRSSDRIMPVGEIIPLHTHDLSRRDDLVENFEIFSLFAVVSRLILISGEALTCVVSRLKS